MVENGKSGVAFPMADLKKSETGSGKFARSSRSNIVIGEIEWIVDQLGANGF